MRTSGVIDGRIARLRLLLRRLRAERRVAVIWEQQRNLRGSAQRTEQAKGVSRD